MVFQRSFHRLKDDENRKLSYRTREPTHFKKEIVIAVNYHQDEHPDIVDESKKTYAKGNKFKRVIVGASKVAMETISSKGWRCFENSVIPYNVPTAFFYGIGPWF